MREIRFRGKRLDSGEWVYGYLTRNDRNGNCYITTQTETGGAHPWRVDPATVGQYTGLKDKNGVEIYEGDIVRCWAGEEYQGVWEFDETITIYFDPSHWQLIEYADNAQVIGNICENPESLEVQP